MHRVLKSFEFYDPSTLGEALQLLSMYGARAKVMAGGVDLVLKMRLREITPEHVVCLQRIPELNYIKGSTRTGLRFGAMTTLHQIETSAKVRGKWSLLYEAVRHISSLQAKTMGTCIGNICVATPASDIAPALLALDARVKITSTAGEKVIPLQNLLLAAGKTSLEPDEIVSEISIPPPADFANGAFMKLSRTADDIAKVNVAVLITMQNGKCKDARIALGAVAPTPIRATEAEESLKEQKLDDKVISRAAEIASQSVSPITDVRSTAEYRRQMVKVLVKDALEKALHSETR